MNRKSEYKDMEKWKQTIKKYKKKYYKQTAVYPPSRWTLHDINLIMEHKLTDRELSEITGHSMKAIQIKRSRLRKSERVKDGSIKEIEKA